MGKLVASYKVHLPINLILAIFGLLFAFLFGIGLSFWFAEYDAVNNQEKDSLRKNIVTLEAQNSQLQNSLTDVSLELTKLKNEDQYIINQNNIKDIAQIKKSYKDAVTSYEELVKVRELTTKTSQVDALFTKILDLLSKEDYQTASTTLLTLTTEMQKIRDSLAAAFAIPANVKISNTAPSAGYSRQSVSVLGGTYLVDLVAGDLSTTKVIVDTASNGDCKNDCPVLPLGDYVSRNGGFAGINGSYFCPASYPSCAGKTNSFDTLLMNKNKTYFNSDNNVYSTVPAVVFLGGSVRFVGKSQEWGRDTGIDSMIANQPLIVSGGNVVFGGDDDPKKGSKGSRSFVANKGNVVYIGVAHNVTVAENAHVLKALGMDNALNLDSGGSTALWSGGYKVGPGRAIPNAIIFVRK